MLRATVIDRRLQWIKSCPSINPGIGALKTWPEDVVEPGEERDESRRVVDGC